MSDIKLFRYNDTGVQELEGKAAALEKHLQALIEKQMQTFLGVRFLASEHDTGKNQRGRIDSLGLDENGCPVIIEYKRHTNENVINQGLFYLDWLLDHKGEFELLVMKQLGKEASESIEWNGTRLLCIAEDYTKYDAHAVQQINRNIELLRYKMFDHELLMLELVNVVTSDSSDKQTTDSLTKAKQSRQSDEHQVRMAAASPELRSLFESTQDYILSLGDEIQAKPLKLYVAFRRMRNFASATVLRKTDPFVCLWLNLDPTTVQLEDGFTRDMSTTGHWATGSLEVTMRTIEDLNRAKPLIERSYREN